MSNPGYIYWLKYSKGGKKTNPKPKLNEIIWNLNKNFEAFIIYLIKNMSIYISESEEQLYSYSIK